jgi:hypothetical protein
VKHLAGISQSLESGTRAKEFATIAKMIAASKGDAGLASQMSRARRASPRVLEILDKAAVDVGLLNDPGNWADPLAQSYGQVAAGFVESLRYSSAFDAIAAANGFRPVPMKTRVSVVTLGATGAEVAQGFSKPISRLELESGTLDPRKAAAVVVVSQELARNASPAALDLFGRELRSACGAATDSAFLAALAAADGSPTTTGGDAAEDALADLSGALASIDGSATSRYFAVIAPATAKAWAFFGEHAFRNMTPAGGSLGGVPITVSDSLPGGVKIIALDANQIAAAPGTVVLDGASHATIALDGESTEGPPQTLTSLWQKNLRAIRAERVFGFELLRASAVAVIEEASE